MLFWELLTEKPFEKITVQDILSAAMINRSTFYEHYADKYELLEIISNSLFSEMMKEMEKVTSENIRDLNLIDDIMKKYFLKNRKILRIMLQIKTAHVDIQKQCSNYLMTYFSSYYPDLSELDLYLLANLLTSFFLYFVEHEENSENFSALMLQSFFSIFVKLVKIDKDPKAKEDLWNLIGKYSSN